MGLRIDLNKEGLKAERIMRRRYLDRGIYIYIMVVSGGGNAGIRFFRMSKDLRNGDYRMFMF